MTKRAPLALSLTLFAGIALPGHAQAPATQPAADPALTQQEDPALVKMVPADMSGKPLTVAVALGSPPDDFRNEQGEVVGWEIDIIRAAAQSLGLGLELRPYPYWYS